MLRQNHVFMRVFVLGHAWQSCWPARLQKCYFGSLPAAPFSVQAAPGAIPAVFYKNHLVYFHRNQRNLCGRVTCAHATHVACIKNTRAGH